VLAEDITPTLEKLRGERTAYLRWAANNTECERLARFCVAYEYVTADKCRDKAKGDAKAEEERAASEAARAVTAKATAASKEAEIRAAEAARSAASGGDFARLTAREEGASRDLTKAEVAAASRRGALREEEKAAKAAAKAADEAAAAVASLTSSLAGHKADAASAGAASEAAAAEVSSLMTKVNAAAAGMAVDDGPSGAGGGTLAEQLLAAKARVSALSSDINTGELKVKHLRAVAKDVAGAGKAAEAEARTNEGALAKAQKALADKQAKLAASGFNVSEDEGLRGRRETVMGELAARGDALESEGASLSHLVDFNYDAAALGGAGGAARVKGVLATLLKVGRPDAATALEVGGGGKLFQVVVDDEVTGKALLERGRLARRVTFIPLSHIRRGRLSDAQVAAARRVAGPDAVWPALELVSYPPEVAPAVEYALGGFLVAKDAATAKAVTFDPAVRAPCVSLEGDMFDPAGTLEGGSKPEAGRDGGGVPTLVRIGRLVAERRAVDALRGELAALDAKLKASSAASASYAALAAEAELAAHDVKLLTSRIATSQAGATAAKAAETAAALAVAEAALADARSALGGAKERVTALEAEGRNVVAAREERVKALEKALAAAKKAAAAAEKKAKDAARAVDTTAAELEAAQGDAAKAAAASAAAGEAVKRAAADLEAAEGDAAKLRAVAEAARAELDAARSALAAADKAVKGLTKERDAAIKEAEDAEAEAKRAAVRSKEAAKEAAAAERTARDLADKHPWIATERQFFGRAHTDYDFGARDPAEALARLKALEKQQGDLERRINKKVIGMIESAEREYADLVAKKRIIENDKAKINVRGGGGGGKRERGGVVLGNSDTASFGLPSHHRYLLSLPTSTPFPRPPRPPPPSLAEGDHGARREEERGAAHDVGQGQQGLRLHLWHAAAGRHGAAGPRKGRRGQPDGPVGARGLQRRVEGVAAGAVGRPALAAGAVAHPGAAAVQAGAHVHPGRGGRGAGPEPHAEHRPHDPHAL
jgi:structural maintenance of chromosome 2